MKRSFCLVLSVLLVAALLFAAAGCTHDLLAAIFTGDGVDFWEMKSTDEV